MVWTEILTVIGIPVGRGLAGWAQNAFADGTIDWPEWRQLAGTVLRLGVPAAALYWGFELDAEFAATIPVVADYLFSYIKKIVEAHALAVAGSKKK